MKSLRPDMEYTMGDVLTRGLRAYARCCLDDTQGESPHRCVSNILNRATASRMQGMRAMLRLRQNMREWRETCGGAERGRLWTSWRTVMPRKLNHSGDRFGVLYVVYMIREHAHRDWSVLEAAAPGLGKRCCCQP